MSWDDDPTTPPDADEVIMNIDFRTEAYQEMRENAADDLERQVREGDVPQKEVYGMLVDANILAKQMDIHLQQVYQTIMVGAIVIGILAVNLLWQFYDTGNYQFGLWGVYALMIALVGSKTTPSGTLKKTLWELYETAWDGAQRILP